MGKFTIADILREALFAEPGGDHDAKNLVDALFAIAEALKSNASALRDLGNGNAATPMGAIEAHSVAVKEALRDAADIVAEALKEIAAEMPRGGVMQSREGD